MTFTLHMSLVSNVVDYAGYRWFLENDFRLWAHPRASNLTRPAEHADECEIARMESGVGS